MNYKLSLLILNPPPAALAAPFWHSVALQTEQEFEVLLMTPEKPSSTGPFSFQALATEAPDRFRCLSAIDNPTLSPAQAQWQQACILVQQAQSDRLIFWDAGFQMHPETLAEHLSMRQSQDLVLGSNSLHPSQALSCFALAAQHLRLFPAARFFIPGEQVFPHFQDFYLHNLSMPSALWPQDWQPQCQSQLFLAWELAMHFQSQPIWALPEARSQALQPLSLETVYDAWQQACKQDAAAFCQRFEQPWPALRFWPTAWQPERDTELLRLAPQRLQWLSQSQLEQRVPLEPQGLYAEAFLDWQTQLLQLWQAALAQQLDAVSSQQNRTTSTSSQNLALWPFEAVPVSENALMAAPTPITEGLTVALVGWLRHKLQTGRGLVVGGQDLQKLGMEPWQKALASEAAETPAKQPVQGVLWLNSEASLLKIWQLLQPHLCNGAWLIFSRTQDPALQAFEKLLAYEGVLSYWGENAEFRCWNYVA